MSVKSKVLSAGVLFFIGGAMMAQKAPKKDSVQKEREIEEVVVQGVRTVTKKTAIGAVQTIKAETLESRPQANVMNAVQGQMAGVNVTASSGQPGAKPTVIIRGAGTLSGNTDPLYVIDGFPSNADNFRNINSYDIESMEVLKDPIALAEYGNRASNGVIVVKTKRGTIGANRMNLRLTSQVGVTFLQRNRYNIANSRDLLRIEKAYGTGRGVGMTDEAINNYAIDTDWLNYFFKPAMMTSHNLSLENSGKNYSMYTSAGYMEQEGMLRGTDYKRFTVRSNVNGRSDNGKFKYYIGMAVGHSKNNDQSALGTAGVNNNPVLGSLKGAPYLSPNEYTGSLDFVNMYVASGGSMLLTPFMLIDRVRMSGREYAETRIDVNSELSYKLTDGLTAVLKTNALYNQQRWIRFVRPNSFNALLFSATRFVTPENGGAYNGQEVIQNVHDFQYNNMFQLDYKKSFGNHTFRVTGSAEYNFFQKELHNYTQTGLDPLTYVVGAGTGYIKDVSTNDRYVPTVLTERFRLNMLSYIGSFDYDFSKKYGIVGSIRRDGTSRFIGDNKWGNFWSVGARWNMEEEEFIKNLGFVNTFKLRGSYGTVGNQRIVSGEIYAGLLPPRFLDVYELSNNAYNGQLGYSISFGDPALRWETTVAYNAGVDFEFFKRRLRGSFDVYQKKTEDMFYATPVSSTLGAFTSTGALTLTKNTDISLYNRGFELSLAYDVLKKSDLQLTLRANGAINNQEVTGIIDNGGVITLTEGIRRRIQNGYRPFLSYLYDYAGVNKENGNLLFRDRNGNLTENPTEEDRVLAKYSHMPKYQGGFGVDFSAGGFFTSATFTFVAGVYRTDYDMLGLSDPSALGQFNVSADLKDAWTPTNTNTDVPALKASNLALGFDSNRFLYDASYIRLRNVQVGYNIPKRYLEGTFLKSLSITLQAENILTWTKWRGFDVESTRDYDRNQYPTPRVVTLGFDVKF